LAYFRILRHRRRCLTRLPGHRQLSEQRAINRCVSIEEEMSMKLSRRTLLSSAAMAASGVGAPAILHGPADAAERQQARG